MRMRMVIVLHHHLFEAGLALWLMQRELRKLCLVKGWA